MSGTVYLLAHRHPRPSEEDGGSPPEPSDPFEDGEPLFRDDRDEDFKILGLYSSIQLAEARIAAARSMPGFRLAPDGFFIHEYTPDEPHWTSGFTIDAEAE